MIPQIDRHWHAVSTLPQEEPRLRWFAERAFLLNAYSRSPARAMDLTQKFYQEQMQIDGGKMDQFVAFNGSKGLTMGYFHTAGLPLAAEARKYVLCDRFFHSAFGGSFLNHMWLVAAATPIFPDAPDSMKAVLDANGHPIAAPMAGRQDGPVTPTYVVKRPTRSTRRIRSTLLR
jgi:phospholipase C